MSQVLREHAIGMPTAWISARAVARPQTMYNHQPKTSLSSIFTSKIVPPGPATRTAAATISLHYLRISAETVRNRLREAQLHSCHSHRCLDLTVVRHRNRLKWANAHIWLRLALWRGVLNGWILVFTVWADGRKRMHCVGECFADVNVVGRVAHGGGGVMVWAGVCYGQYWWHFECTEMLWRDPEAHCRAIHPSRHVPAW